MDGKGERMTTRTGARVTCNVCPRACSLVEGQTGACLARMARGGTVVAGNYGHATALALDPMEKKPIARYLPGTYVLSVGSYGCNFHCPFCQNASIAAVGESDVAWHQVTPQELVKTALEQRHRGCVGIAYTYNEPLVGWEFVQDTAVLAHESDLKNVLVSNGCASSEVVGALLPLIDAANIDLKGFSQEFYDFVGGDLESVKATIAAMAACPSCHLEVTTLVIPGINDSPEEIDAASAWLASLDPNIPYHLTRFFPRHRLQNLPPTPLDTLRKLKSVAEKHLNDVLLGNV